MRVQRDRSLEVNTQAIIDAIRKAAMVPDDKPVAVVSSYCKMTDVDVSSGNRDIISLITTDDMDQSDEVVSPEGADWSYLIANGKVFADHNYGLNSAVGTLREGFPQAYPSKMMPKAWKARARIYDKPGMKQLGDDILYMARTGGVGVSIGFEPMEYGSPTIEETKAIKAAGKPVPRTIHRKWMGLEFSYTAFPCNVNCQGVACTAPDTEKRMQAVDEMVVKGMIRRESASALGLPITPKRRHFAVIEPTRRRVVLVD